LTYGGLILWNAASVGPASSTGPIVCTVATPSLADLRAAWTAGPGSGPRRMLIHLLADGRPVTAESLAAATGLSIEIARADIADARRRGLEVDQHGAVIGAALSLRPTSYRFRIRDHDLYAWCGFDALFLPIVLGERAEVASTCPVTGQAIHLAIEADGTVSLAEPAGVVVGIVGPQLMRSLPDRGAASAVCAQMPLFASRAAGLRWQVDNSGVAIVDLDDARDIARLYVQFSPGQ
jgi:alkylmercury lyase